MNQPIYQLQWTPPAKKRSDPNNTLTLTTLITHQSNSKDKPIKSIPTHTIPKERNKEKTRTPTWQKWAKSLLIQLKTNHNLVERERFQLTRLMGGAKLTRFPFFRLEPGCFLKKHKKKTPKKQNALRKHKQTANVFTKQKTNKDKNLNEEWRVYKFASWEAFCGLILL